ncbi:MAG: copper resistance protein CopC [Caldilineaceae bacterium]
MSRNARLCGKIIFFLAFYLFFGTHNAFAHAEIIRAEPADGAELAESPATMTLWFNETIVEHFSSVQVLDLQNQSVSGVTIQADPAERDLLYVMLPTLAPGGYTVFWKVLSDSDGHLSQGFTTLTIGPDAVSRHSAAMPAGAETPVPVEALLRWLNYLLLTSLIGALAMLRWVVASVRTQSSPGAILAQHQLRRRVRWLAVGCAAGAFLLGFGILGWQVTRTQVDTTVGAGVSTQLWFLLSQTQWGIFWLVRQGLLLFLTVALWVLATLPKEPDALWPWLLIYGRAVDLAIVQALTGHAGSASHAWVLVLGAATVHLLAAGVWMGGLLTLFLIFWPTRDRIQSLSPGWRPIVWPAFTRAAVVSVGLLFASGLYRMGQQVASVDALLTTRYGQLLISKGLLVVVVGICGLANALVVHPAFTASLRRRLSGRIVERLTEPDGRQPLLPARFRV